MAEVIVEADLTGVDGFPTGEKLRHHEDQVVRYSPVKEAVVVHVPATELLTRLPLVRVFFFLYVLLCLWCIGAFCIGPFLNQSAFGLIFCLFF
jgi:hypothetical protein